MATEVHTTRDDWLEARRLGVGASEVAAVLSVCPWLTRYQLWARKRGLVDDEFEATKAMTWGLRLQDAIAEGYSEDTGRHVARTGDYEVQWSTEWPHLFATLDAIQEDPAKGCGVLELKAVGIHQRDKWQEDAPEHYQAQLQAQLAVTGMQWGTIGVLIGGQDLRWVDYDRDERLIAEMGRRIEHFWTLVQSGVEPEVDGSEETTKLLQKLHPDDNGQEVQLAPGMAEYIERRAKAKARIKTDEALVRECENHLRQAMGENTFARIPGIEGRLSLKTVERKMPAKDAYTQKFRQFREVK